MSNLITRAHITDEKWQEHAETNAEHRAKIFVDAGKPEKVALALKELPYKRALHFLYDLGKKYLHHHDRRAHTVARASELIEKKHITEKEQKFEKHFLPVKRYTVSEIFEQNI